MTMMMIMMTMMIAYDYGCTAYILPILSQFRPAKLSAINPSIWRKKINLFLDECIYIYMFICTYTEEKPQ